MRRPNRTARLRAIAGAAERIQAKSFTIDVEAVVLGPDGLSRFEELRRREAAHKAILHAFDLIEHDGEDLRIPLEDYFEGNTQEESIAPNQVGFGRPSLERMYEILKAIRARPDVQTVVVGLHPDWREAMQACSPRMISWLRRTSSTARESENTAHIQAILRPTAVQRSILIP